MRTTVSWLPLPSTGKRYSIWILVFSRISFTSVVTPGRAGTLPTSSPVGERTERESRSATVFHTDSQTSPACSPTRMSRSRVSPASAMRPMAWWFS